jgi:TRAP-type C4-dicarboxylate transport system permease small subunit
MLRALTRGLEVVLTYVAGTTLLAMMFLTFFDVVGRYAFHKSIFGTAEMVQLLMVGTIFAGMAFVTSAGGHINVSFFESWFERRMPRLYYWAVALFTIVSYALITFELWHLSLTTWQDGTTTQVLSLPEWLIPFFAAVFSTLGVLLMVIHSFRPSPPSDPSIGLGADF